MTQAAVGFGANLGRPDRAFREALGRLAETGGLVVAEVSRLWRSAPWGVADQPWFLNAVALFETTWEAREVLALLQHEERHAGRRPGRRWGPRVLDLDLLTWGSQVVEEPALLVPHPRMHERPFVLEPLAEVAPEWVHPRTGRTCREMLAVLRASGRGGVCRPVEGVRLGETVEGEACLR